MSLAEVHPALEWPAFPVSPSRRAQPRPSADPITSPVVETEPVQAEPASPDAAAPRDFGVAFCTLRKGAQDLERLEAQCHQLQVELAEAEEKQRSDREAAATELARWQTVSTHLMDMWQHSKARLAEATALAGEQSERADRQGRRAEAAELRLAAFEKIATGFLDQIVVTFGVKDQGSA